MLLKVPILFGCYAMSTGKRLPLIYQMTRKTLSKIWISHIFYTDNEAARTEQEMDNTYGNNTELKIWWIYNKWKTKRPWKSIKNGSVLYFQMWDSRYSKSFLCFFASCIVNMQYRTPSSTCKTADTNACKTYRTITVYTTVFVKMNPRDGNM